MDLFEMADHRLDVLAIGNAIVDVIANADDAFVETLGMPKGSMRLIDEPEARRLYEAMGPGRELSGGSAANTVAGIAALGLKSGFIGQTGGDQLGEIFAHDIRSLGVEFATPPRADVGETGRCLIVVTPDAQRTMNTYLGAAQHLPASALDEAQIRASAILYLEGYLWDPETPRYTMLRAIELARSAGRKVALTLSDSFVVDRHRDGFHTLLDEGRIDILFANEAEIQSLAAVPHLETAIAAVRDKVDTLVVTRSEKGAVATQAGERAEVPAAPIEALVDTTGAGDLFAAGFLSGQALGKDLEQSLWLGAICASEVIQHPGARPQADLKALAGELIN